jgi:hypothetical protein
LAQESGHELRVLGRASKHVHYLNVEVYGNKGNRSEFSLMLKYYDCFQAELTWYRYYERIEYGGERDFPFSKYVNKMLPRKTTSHLPNPFNLGQEWYPRSIEIIERELGTIGGDGVRGGSSGVAPLSFKSIESSLRSLRLGASRMSFPILSVYPILGLTRKGRMNSSLVIHPLSD